MQTLGRVYRLLAVLAFLAVLAVGSYTLESSCAVWPPSDSPSVKVSAADLLNIVLLVFRALAVLAPLRLAIWVTTHACLAGGLPVALDGGWAGGKTIETGLSRSLLILHEVRVPPALPLTPLLLLVA